MAWFGPAWATWRLRLRSTGRTLAALVVLLGLAGGAAIAAAAAARRTASAYPRYLDASEAPDLTVDAPPVAEVDEAIAELPQVERVTHSHGVPAAPPDGAGRPDVAAIDQILVSEDGRFLRSDRLAVVEGRPPIPRVRTSSSSTRRWRRSAGSRSATTSSCWSRTRPGPRSSSPAVRPSSNG